MCRETCRMTTPSRKKQQEPSSDSNSVQRSWIMQRRFCFLKREVFSIWCDAFHFWRWRSGNQDDHQRKKSNDETRVPHPQSCAWLIVRRNQLGFVNPNQICWHQKPTRRHTDKRQIHTWWVEQPSPSVQYQHFQLSQLSRSAEKNATRNRWREIFPLSKPTLNLISRTAASSPTEPSSSASSRPGILRAPSQQGSQRAAVGSNQNDAVSSSQVWLTDAKNSERARKLAAADTNQDQSFPERARKLVAENVFFNDEDDSKWPHNLRISRASVRHLEKVYVNLRWQLKREHEDNGSSQCKYVDMGNVYDGHPVSRSSSWWWLFGQFTNNQKSVTKNNETIVRCNKEGGQRTNRKSRFFPDRLARGFLEKDDSVDWPSSSVVNSENPRILRFSIVHGKNSWHSRTKGRRKLNDLWTHPNIENWIESTESRWSSSGHFPRMHCIADSRRDPKHYDWN